MGMVAVYWAILISCYIIASKLRNMADKFTFLPAAMMASIYILVFTMGLRMGINRQVTSSLGSIGLKALIITAFTIAGSVAAIFAVRKLLGMDRFGNVGRDSVSDECHDAQKTDTKEQKKSIDFKSTIIIFALVAAGIVIGKAVVADNFPQILPQFSDIAGNALTFFLCVLIAVIGFDLGMSGTVAKNLRSMGARIIAFPIAVASGTFITGIITGCLMGFSVKESLAISAGFGWYSYAPAIITAAGPQYAVAGAVSFMHNVIREMAGILLIPIFARKIGYLESLGIPGIGAMDVCMPMVERSCREDTVVYSFVTGFVLCIITSLLVPLLMSS